jgi:hypothetical protein
MHVRFLNHDVAVVWIQIPNNLVIRNVQKHTHTHTHTSKSIQKGEANIGIYVLK